MSFCFEGLDAFTDEQLRQELKRRSALRKPSATFRCDRCGIEGYFVGEFSSSRFEMQYDQFHQEHRKCKSYFGGGGI